MKSLALKNTARRIVKFLCFFVFSLVFFSVFLPQVKAATLSFSPSSGIYTAGSSITVNVIVSSADKTMNGASGVISFPTDLFSVSSISKTDSIIDFWAQDPSFSNTAGTINFEGVVLPPWYKGSSGKLLTITFKAKTSGTANLSFTSGSVLAADGSGTDITSSLGNASYQISGSSQTAPVIVPPAKNTGVPSAPEITSLTHPDSTKWYASSVADFAWGLPADITGTKVLIGQKPDSSPTVLYSPPISSKEVKDLKDGIWYFHVQLRNNNGWSDVSHFKLQIDTEKPTSFDITEIARTDPTEPKAKFTFVAADKTSGIDYYKVQIDNGPVEIWKNDGSNTYQTPAEEGGNHTIFAKAVDKAGNFITNSAEFSIEALEAPVITDYPKEIQTGEALIVKGTTKYPNFQLSLSLQDEKGVIKNYSSTADAEGNFTVTLNEGLKEGKYTSWVQVTDNRGARSLTSEKVVISSAKQSFFITLKTRVIGFVTTISPFIALILAIILLSWFIWSKVSNFRRKLKYKNIFHKTSYPLKEIIQKKVKRLEKIKSERQLTAKEEKINEQFKEEMKDIEAYIRKEINHVDEIINK